MEIVVVKLIHVGSVLLSYLLFFMRGMWMVQSSPILLKRWVKIVPHIIDTVLLLSAVLLAWLMSLSPLQHGWLMAKILALLAYILLGTFALKRGRTFGIRIACLIAAQFAFIYIVWVAVTHLPFPWMSLLSSSS